MTKKKERKKEKMLHRENKTLFWAQDILVPA